MTESAIRYTHACYWIDPHALPKASSIQLTEKQQKRIANLFAEEKHVEVEATWGAYQRMIAAYREEDPVKGKKLMQALIDSLTSGVPAALKELKKMGGTLKRRAADILAYFDRPGTSNCPTESIQCRHRHWIAYADVWVMPTTATSGWCWALNVGDLSA